MKEILLDFSSLKLEFVGNFRQFLLDELENRRTIHSWECLDTDENITDLGCLLLLASYEDEATFWYQESLSMTTSRWRCRFEYQECETLNLSKHYGFAEM